MSLERRRAVFLDRDGTLIEETGYLSTVEDLRLLPGAAAALRRLKEAGFLLIVVTNQSAVARGWLSEEQVQQIHRELNDRLDEAGARIDAFYYCPHLPDGTVARYAFACDCRKPAPGMLQRAAAEWGIDTAASYMVGDSERDVEAGHRAGCCGIFIGSEPCPPADATAKDLQEASEFILAKESAVDAG